MLQHKLSSKACAQALQKRLNADARKACRRVVRKNSVSYECPSKDLFIGTGPSARISPLPTASSRQEGVFRSAVETRTARKVGSPGAPSSRMPRTSCG